MKHLNIGIIAHVDSGKTTLSESILYLTGSIRSFGRVDKGASFLDNESLERKRGITIFSKQARFTYKDTSFTLIDTPGHADFSAETERTLAILDAAVLIISAPDGVRPQTSLLWDLLSEHRIPVFIFINKTDQENPGRDSLMKELSVLTGDRICDLSGAEDTLSKEQLEIISCCSDEAMETYLSSGSIPDGMTGELIKKRLLFPCFFGSAINNEGVSSLLGALSRYMPEPVYPEEFSAVVYKIARDNDNNRLTFVKITGGCIRPKTLLPDGDGESKINQIRLYSGERYTLAESASGGEVCAFTGLKESYAGQCFGNAKSAPPRLTPVLSYRVITGDDTDPVTALPCFRILEEESPELSVTWDEERKDIYVFVMGQVQLEILTSLLKERFDLNVSFDSGEVMYRETIASPVTGVGHFEPLRHYAEVHLKMEPLPEGSGLVFERDLSTDRLSENWQRSIMSILKEIRFKGVLTGSPVTDMKVTLTAGKAHLKHTEGGDFRQAVSRAVRQGLMSTDCVLLEPFYRFTFELPSENIGRAMTDLERMNAVFSLPGTSKNENMSVISGRGPVSALKDYPAELTSYTRGNASVTFIPDGYSPCANAEEIIENIGYDPLSDAAYPSSSVFCRHGSGVIIPYDEVYEHMHIPFENTADPSDISDEDDAVFTDRDSDILIGPDEVEAIISGISGANQSPKKAGRKWKRKYNYYSVRTPDTAPSAPSEKQPAFLLKDADILLADGYNIIFAWDDLKKLANDNIDSARDSLIEILGKYSAMTDTEVIAVFDAYRVKGRSRETLQMHNIRIVYTSEDETADRYIERFTNEKAKSAKVAVVTSDNAERGIARGHGCMIITSKAFRSYVEDITESFNDRYGIE